MNARILVVEDDRFLQQNLVRLLMAEDYEVIGVASGEEALTRLEASTAELVVLDLGLPGMDGLTTCRRIRKKWNMPVLMLTAKTDAMDKVLGLETGADDYLTKPFEAIEFIARVRAQLRRQTNYQEPVAKESQKTFELGKIKVDQDRRIVTVQGKTIDLTSREYEMLVYLAANCDRAVSREQLFEQVWGYEMDFSTNSLDVHIYRLRKKLEANPEKPEYLHTIRGFGYKLSFAPAKSVHGF